MEYKVGAYVRLSREDENKSTNFSESINNQKEYILKYILDNNLNLVNIYIDDGFSGTNFNRPGFQRMIQDIQGGKVNLVITKDLSRLGRNYIETGYYTEHYFKDVGVRYIAINDGIDTINDNNDIVLFKK